MQKEDPDLGNRFEGVFLFARKENYSKENEKMNKQIFEYQGKNVRTVIKNEEVWFVAKDVCEVLEHTDTSTAIKRLDDDEKLTQTMFVSGQNREVWIINESGLYSLILSSRKPEAKQFKRWITHEVLPSIRKHGTYMTDDVIEKTLTDPDFIIQIATQLKEEKIKRLEAEKKIEEDKPLVTFAETCLKSKDNILVRQLSKIAQDEGMNIGEKKLYNKLREWNMILKHSTEPSQTSMNSGYFVVEEVSVDTAYGVKLNKTTKVTPKGQVYIINKLKNELNK
jgi:anti-repressor protein